MAATLVTCTVCGSEVPEADSYYGTDGQICTRCFDSAEQIKSFRSAILATGSASLGLSVFSFVAPFILMIVPGAIIWTSMIAVMGISSGLRTFGYWQSKDPNIVEARKGQIGAVIMAVLGCIVGLLRVASWISVTFSAGYSG